MPPVVNRSAYLQAVDYPLATPAARILDLSPLYGLAMRGRVETLPYVEGGVGYQHRIDHRSVVLPLLVEGRYKADGTTHTNLYAGLDDNIDEIIAQVVTPGAAAYPWYWYRATGDMLEADVFVDSFEPQAWGHGWVRFGLGLVIPAGRFQ